MKCSECGHRAPVHSLTCGRRFLPLPEQPGYSKEYSDDLNEGHGNWDIEPAPWAPNNLNAGY